MAGVERAYGVMGIEERWREPRRGVAVVPFWEGVEERGVSRSLRNWALFMLFVGGFGGGAESRRWA